MRTTGVLAICVALLAGASGALPAAAQDMKKQYWATSLARTVDDGLLRGLDAAVARGEIGWLDVEPKHNANLRLRRGVNLIFYHVGGNCYIGDDCDRYPDSEDTGDRWGDNERSLDLEDEEVRDILIADLVGLVRKADKIAPAGAVVGVHVDNVHKLLADGLADLFNEYLAAVEKARREGSISKDRKVGYVAKNNAAQFQRALTEKLLKTPPLYQIQENAELDQDGMLDFRLAHRGRDRAALQYPGVPQDVRQRRRLHLPRRRGGQGVARHGGEDGAEPHISGVAWSRDESSYRPTLYVQGAPVRQLPPGAVPACE